jgi:hypothetical protein
MTNMFSLEEHCSGTFFNELRADIEEECKRFGELAKVHVEMDSPGYVWVRYRSQASAIKMQETLIGKYFDRKKIFCYYVSE